MLKNIKQAAYVLAHDLIYDDRGQDIWSAEYAVMLAVILVIVIGTVRLIGTHANDTFNNVASALGPSN